MCREDTILNPFLKHTKTLFEFFGEKVLFMDIQTSFFQTAICSSIFKEGFPFLFKAVLSL